MKDGQPTNRYVLIYQIEAILTWFLSLCLQNAQFLKWLVAEISKFHFVGVVNLDGFFFSWACEVKLGAWFVASLPLIVRKNWSQVRCHCLHLIGRKSIWEMLLSTVSNFQYGNFWSLDFILFRGFRQTLGWS